ARVLQGPDAGGELLPFDSVLKLAKCSDRRSLDVLGSAWTIELAPVRSLFQKSAPGHHRGQLLEAPGAHAARGARTVSDGAGRSGAGACAAAGGVAQGRSHSGAWT